MSQVSCKIWANRHGLQIAKERLAAGEVWKIFFGGALLFSIVDAACVRAGIEMVDGDDRPYEYWVVEAFARASWPSYAEAIEQMGFLHPMPGALPDSTRLQRALWETLVLITKVNVRNWWLVTDTGYIASVEREVQQGDQLCSIFGCRQPFVLGPRDGGGFQLVAMPRSEDFLEDSHRKRESELVPEVFTLW